MKPTAMLTTMGAGRCDICGQELKADTVIWRCHTCGLPRCMSCANTEPCGNMCDHVGMVSCLNCKMVLPETEALEIETNQQLCLDCATSLYPGFVHTNGFRR